MPGPTQTSPPAPQTPTFVATTTPSVPAGFILVSTGTFHLVITSTWTVQRDPDEETLLVATSPLGGASVTIYYSRGGLGTQSLRDYVVEGQETLEGIWETQIVRSESTLGEVPAFRLEAVQNFPVTRAHILYYAEFPAGSKDVWNLALSNDGDESDPSFDSVIDSFGFGP